MVPDIGEGTRGPGGHPALLPRERCCSSLLARTGREATGGRVPATWPITGQTSYTVTPSEDARGTLGSPATTPGAG